MKGSNFILTGSGPVIIDLDALQEHALGWNFRRLHCRDMQRFMRNWEDCPEIAAFFKASLVTSRCLLVVKDSCF